MGLTTSLWDRNFCNFLWSWSKIIIIKNNDTWLHCFLRLSLPESTSKSSANSYLPIFNTKISHRCTYFALYTSKIVHFPVIQFSLSKALPSKMRSVKQTQFCFNQPQAFLGKSTSDWRISRVPDTVFCFRSAAFTKIKINCLKKTLNPPSTPCYKDQSFFRSLSISLISVCGDHCISPRRAARVASWWCLSVGEASHLVLGMGDS